MGDHLLKLMSSALSPKPAWYHISGNRRELCLLPPAVALDVSASQSTGDHRLKLISSARSDDPS
jgi:hypothetical protein